VIINVPAADDYSRTGLDLLNLSWRQVDDLYASLLLFDHDTAASESAEERAERHRQYWDAADRQIANAIVLAQQAIEFLLKGRIAAVSPYLLIANDPKDWPRADRNNKIEFSQFRSIDAVQLPKILNCVLAQKLPDEFQAHYDYLRDLRNRLMHSVGRAPIQGPDFYKLVLKSFKHLEPGKSWFRERQRHLESDERAVLYSGDDARYQLVKEVLRVIDSLGPAECFELLGFDKRKRRYLCPSCEMELHALEDMGAYLCQFPGDEPGQTSLKCYLCEECFEVERTRCSDKNCEGDVIWVEDELCLTCGDSQMD
jgi:hypothetical protein